VAGQIMRFFVGQKIKAIGQHHKTFQGEVTEISVMASNPAASIIYADGKEGPFDGKYHRVNRAVFYETEIEWNMNGLDWVFEWVK
jgi:hypothetical protein